MIPVFNLVLVHLHFTCLQRMALEKDIIGPLLNYVHVPLTIQDTFETKPYCVNVSLCASVSSHIYTYAFDNINCFPCAELSSQSPLLHTCYQLLESWEDGFTEALDDFKEAAPKIAAKVDRSTEREKRPSLLKHKSLLDPQNSPFL